VTGALTVAQVRRIHDMADLRLRDSDVWYANEMGSGVLWTRAELLRWPGVKLRLRQVLLDGAWKQFCWWRAGRGPRDLGSMSVEGSVACALECPQNRDAVQRGFCLFREMLADEAVDDKREAWRTNAKTLNSPKPIVPLCCACGQQLAYAVKTVGSPDRCADCYLRQQPNDSRVSTEETRRALASRLRDESARGQLAILDQAHPRKYFSGRNAGRRAL
jgi:hypothetical protein